MRRKIHRGDLYYADLNPVVGSEQGGVRPVLVISNNTGNFYSPTVIIAMISSRCETKAKLPTHYPIEAGNGVKKDSVILLEQLRTIDKMRLKEFLGSLDSRCMENIDDALAISIGINTGSLGSHLE